MRTSDQSNYIQSLLVSLRSFIIATGLALSFAVPAYAAIVTNAIQSLPAINGSCVFLVHLYDTSTSNYFIGHLKIIDKKQRILTDIYQPGGYATCALEDFSGKRLLISTGQDVSWPQRRYILYKVTRKGLKYLNNQIVTNGFSGHIRRSCIAIYQATGLSNSFTVFNKKLSKLLYRIPPQHAQMAILSDKGIFVTCQNICSAIKIRYYKRGKQFAEHNLPYLSNGFYHTFFDKRGGLLYWVTIGPLSSQTNLPMTCVKANGKIIADKITIPDTDHDCIGLAWDGKFLYINDNNGKTVAACKISRNVKKKGEVVEPDAVFVMLDGRHVYLLTADGGDKGVIEYNRTLRKKKWTEPCRPGMLRYLGKGVFMRQTCVDNGFTGYDNTITIFNKRTTIATHHYLQRY